ncbi:hypothetical protein, partial [Wolbachia endosymbiont of Atemnus politus]|uniref:hypothetical protein n=1 Tax=Wolbachia endosymbiont of Atemnus politus TaxID=2682840 RepID=UPI001C552B70
SFITDEPVGILFISWSSLIYISFITDEPVSISFMVLRLLNVLLILFWSPVLLTVATCESFLQSSRRKNIAN